MYRERDIKIKHSHNIALAPAEAVLAARRQELRGAPLDAGPVDLVYNISHNII